MILQHTLRAFPPPEYITMAGAGIDISTGSVKSVVLKRGPSGAELSSYQTIDLEEGVIVEGDIEKPDRLVEALRTLRLRDRVHFAHISLLERKSYLYQALIPHVEKDRRAAVEFTLEGNVPIPPAEAAFDFEVVRKVEAGTIVAVSVYARRIIDAYKDVFKKAGIQLRSVEIESQATARAVLTKEQKQKTILLVDFGKKTTRIAVLDCGAVSFTATVDVGGDAMTAAIMKHFSISPEEAEKIKNEQGFLEGGKGRELYEALMSTVSVLRDELLSHLSFWNSPDERDVPRRIIEGVVIVGGNANLKGLPEYLSRILGLPVLVGNVWANAFSLDEFVPAMPMNKSLQYATAIGLALRSHAHTW